MPFIVYYSQCLDSVDKRCCHHERKLSVVSHHLTRQWVVFVGGLSGALSATVIALNLTNPHRHTYDFLATTRKPTKAILRRRRYGGGVLFCFRFRFRWLSVVEPSSEALQQLFYFLPEFLCASAEQFCRANLNRSVFMDNSSKCFTLNGETYMAIKDACFWGE